MHGLVNEYIKLFHELLSTLIFRAFLLSSIYSSVFFKAKKKRQHK